MTTIKLFPALFSASILIASCQKNGDPQTVLTYSEINVAWNYNPYPEKVFSVEVDGEKITDSLMYQNSNPNYNEAAKRILGDRNPKRFVLKDADAGTVLIDTLIHIESRTKIRLLALSTTDKPVIAGESEQPADPANRDTAKYSFIYNDIKLPDSIIMTFYSGDDSQIPAYNPEAFETLVMKRNTFSRYLNFAFNNYPNTVFYFSIKDAKTGDMIQDIDGNTFVGFGYGIYLGGNYTSPTSFKFNKVLIRYADPNEPDEFKRDRFYDQVIGQTAW